MRELLNERNVNYYANNLSTRDLDEKKIQVDEFLDVYGLHYNNRIPWTYYLGHP